MRKLFSGFLRISLIGFEIIGLLIYAVGIFSIWRVRVPLTEISINTLDTLSTAMDTSGTILDISQRSLVQVEENLWQLSITLDSLSVSLKKTTPLIASVSELLGDDLPKGIQAARASLESAQTAAEIIDNTLYALTSFFLYQGKPYNPDTSLHQGLADTATHLGEISNSLGKVDTSLQESNQGVLAMESQFETFSMNVKSLIATLHETRGAIEEYQKTVETIQTHVENIQTHIAAWITWAAIFISVLILWAGLTQTGFVILGFHMIDGQRDPSS